MKNIFLKKMEIRETENIFDFQKIFWTKKEYEEFYKKTNEFSITNFNFSKKSFAGIETKNWK